MVDYEKIVDTLVSLYYMFFAYQTISRVMNIERKMRAIDEQQEQDMKRVASVGSARFTVERSLIDEDIDKKQNNMRFSVYKKIGITIILTLLPFYIKHQYYKRNQREMNSAYLTLISVGSNILVNQLFDLDLTTEELDFVDT